MAVAVAVAAGKVRVKPAARVQHVHRATALLHLAETGHRAHKAQRALKVKAKAAAKGVAVTVVELVAEGLAAAVSGVVGTAAEAWEAGLKEVEAAQPAEAR